MSDGNDQWKFRMFKLREIGCLIHILNLTKSEDGSAVDGHSQGLSRQVTR